LSLAGLSLRPCNKAFAILEKRTCVAIKDNEKPKN
jgi:hypothetical protein